LNNRHVRPLKISPRSSTNLFVLPAGYRPAKSRQFVALAANNTACRLVVLATGAVEAHGLTSNSLLSLESVRFDAA
jgi:hypothetical protein